MIYNNFNKINKRQYLKTYYSEDIEKFSKLSKDFNPIHLDKKNETRLIFGKRIVHGMLVLVDILEKISLKKISHKVNSINCNFLKPIFLDFKIYYRMKNYKDCTFIEIISDNQTCVYFELSSKYFKLDKKMKSNLSFKLKSNLNSKKYLNISKELGSHTLRLILFLSYLVGMKFPGKYSIFSNLKFSIEKKYQNIKMINFLLKKNKKFNFYEGFGKNFPIYFDAIKHPKFSEQTSFKTLKSIINFKKAKKLDKKSRCLVIGGSRGIGELTLKILLLLGAQVNVTYNKNYENLNKIKKETQTLSHKLKMQKYDIFNDNVNFKNYKYIFYFPTPKIKTSEKKFNKELFQNYNLFYNIKFIKFCRKLSKNNNAKVFFPSTIFLNSDIEKKKFSEYCKAKKLAEENILKFNKNNNNLKIYSYRIEQQYTDQNLSFINNNLKRKFDTSFFQTILKFCS
tara:strand:- start:1226 stop:2584 length:1359 start_codon:yes stop_codon:yes gene_type:complete